MRIQTNVPYFEFMFEKSSLYILDFQPTFEELNVGSRIETYVCDVITLLMSSCTPGAAFGKILYAS